MTFAHPKIIRPVPLEQLDLAGLDPSLHEFVLWDGPFGPMFDHPLHREISLRLIAAKPRHRLGGVVIPAGLGSINAAIKMKTDIRDAAALCGDWHRYVFVHHKPYRVEALLDVIGRVGASRVWPLVGKVWVDSEDNMAAANEWAEVWSHAYDRDGSFRKGLKRVMGAADRRAYDALPKVFTCYRGCAVEHHVDGYSWTLDRDKAEWFARRGARGGIVAKVEVHKSMALAYFNERQESEIVLDAPDLSDDAEIEHLLPIDHQDRMAA